MLPLSAYYTGAWVCKYTPVVSVRLCACEMVVFLSELISSYPPPIPPQRAVNRVSGTRWEMAQLSPAAEIWAGPLHCFFPTEHLLACVIVYEGAVFSSLFVHCEGQSTHRQGSLCKSDTCNRTDSCAQNRVCGSRSNASCVLTSACAVFVYICGVLTIFQT